MSKVCIHHEGISREYQILLHRITNDVLVIGYVEFLYRRVHTILSMLPGPTNWTATYMDAYRQYGYDTAGIVKLDTLPYDCNMREQMAMIHVFFNCVPLLMAMLKHRNMLTRLINIEHVENVIKRATTEMGFDEPQSFFDEYDKSPRSAYRTFKNALYAISGGVMQRYDKFVTLSKLENHVVLEKDIVLPLSDTEKRVVKEAKQKIGFWYLQAYADQNPLPWIPSMSYTVIEESSALVTLANRGGNTLLGGVSKKTCTFIEGAKFFKGFNLNWSVLACVAYEGESQLHTPFEVLLAAQPFGLDYDSDIPAREYVSSMIH